MTERKLAAILLADVVGYSRLMAEDEATTVHTITEYREEIGRVVRRYDGRVVDAPGDNLLAEVPTATGALRCAVEIQQVIRARNAGLSVDRRMAFRIGVHLGEVRVLDDRIYGDGVNIAARLESLAEPGGICISGEVQAQTRGKLEVDYEDLGEREVKNIPQPVRVFRVCTEPAEPKQTGTSRRKIGIAAGLLAVVIALWAVVQERQTPVVRDFGGRPAIAVLAFDNLSGDPEQEYFADGIAEDLITRLSLWRSFPVIARNSSFVYKGKAVDVKRVSADLGVRYVVEGSVRRSGDRVRIGAQLIDAHSGSHVWANTYDRDLADIFALQDEISAAIAASMLGELEQTEAAQALGRDPGSLEAWDLYLRATWHFRRLTAADNGTARVLCEQALAVDPYFASAYARIAATHFWDIVLGFTDSPDRSLDELLRTARRSVEINPKEPLGHTWLAAGFGLSGDGERMLTSAGRAVELNPSLPEALHILGWTSSGSGQAEESIATLQKCLRLDPHGPQAALCTDDLAFAYLVAGRYSEGIEASGRAIALRPDYLWAYVNRAAILAYLGRDDEARSSLEDALRLKPDLSEAFIRRTFAFVEDSVLERFLSGLRKAGFGPDELSDSGR